ncbi:MAG: hypothetical protein ACTSQE_06140 [Candidatus Heimdallarchaeaceae archaeon]
MRRERLPKGSLEVIELLEKEGALTQKAIIDKLKQMKPRSVRYTVRQLIDRSILSEIANFDDMRSSLIGLNKKMETTYKSLLDQVKNFEILKT